MLLKNRYILHILFINLNFLNLNIFCSTLNDNADIIQRVSAPEPTYQMNQINELFIFYTEIFGHIRDNKNDNILPDQLNDIYSFIIKMDKLISTKIICLNDFTYITPLINLINFIISNNKILDKIDNSKNSELQSICNILKESINNYRNPESNFKELDWQELSWDDIHTKNIKYLDSLVVFLYQTTYKLKSLPNLDEKIDRISNTLSNIKTKYLAYRNFILRFNDNSYNSEFSIDPVAKETSDYISLLNQVSNLFDFYYSKDSREYICKIRKEIKELAHFIKSDIHVCELHNRINKLEYTSKDDFDKKAIYNLSTSQDRTAFICGILDNIRFLHIINCEFIILCQLTFSYNNLLERVQKCIQYCPIYGLYRDRLNNKLQDVIKYFNTKLTLEQN